MLGFSGEKREPRYPKSRSIPPVLSIPGCIMWYRNEDLENRDRITVWPDRSGNNNHGNFSQYIIGPFAFGQNSNPSAEIGIDKQSGRPCIINNAVSPINQSIYTVGNPFTVFMVCRWAAFSQIIGTPYDTRPLYMNGAGVYSGLGRTHAIHEGRGFGDYYSYIGSNELQLWRFLHGWSPSNNSFASFWVINGSYTGGYSSAVPSANTANFIGFGANSLMEVIVYNNVIEKGNGDMFATGTADQIASMERVQNYLLDKFNIPRAGTA